MNASHTSKVLRDRDHTGPTFSTDASATQEPFTIHFAFGTAYLTEADRQALRDKLPALTNRRLAIVGYTDNIGPPAFNDWLALRRAESVKHYLVDLGLDSDDIRISGRAQCCYIQNNAALQGRAASRRAEIRSASPDKPINQPGELPQ